MKKLTQEEFIQKCVKKHGDKYDYFLVEYKDCESKINIICHQHGLFQQSAISHSSGYGCAKCSNDLAKIRYSHTDQQFIEKAKLVHQDIYDYSLVEYKNAQTKVKIICNIHGIFEQLPSNHVKGVGCAKCAGKIVDSQAFIEKAGLVHKNKFDYSKVEYKNSNTKVVITCLKHGDFLQIPKTHLRGHGCFICRESSGETMVKEFLIKNKIKYIQEYSFDDCKYINRLFFDFYLPNLNILIEYDGEQHFKIVDFFGGQNRLKQTQDRDEIKNQFCLKNNIKLIRIRYDEEVEAKLQQLL